MVKKCISRFLVLVMVLSSVTIIGGTGASAAVTTLASKQSAVGAFVGQTLVSQPKASNELYNAFSFYSINTGATGSVAYNGDVIQFSSSGYNSAFGILLNLTNLMANTNRSACGVKADIPSGTNVKISMDIKGTYTDNAKISVLVNGTAKFSNTLSIVNGVLTTVTATGILTYAPTDTVTIAFTHPSGVSYYSNLNIEKIYTKASVYDISVDTTDELPTNVDVKYGVDESVTVSTPVSWAPPDAYGEMVGTIDGFATNVLVARAVIPVPMLLSSKQLTTGQFIPTGVPAIARQTDSNILNNAVVAGLYSLNAGTTGQTLTNSAIANGYIEASNGGYNSNYGVTLDLKSMLNSSNNSSYGVSKKITSGDTVKVSMDITNRYSTGGAAGVAMLVNDVSQFSGSVNVAVANTYYTVTAIGVLNFTDADTLKIKCTQPNGTSRYKNLKIEKVFTSASVSDVAVGSTAELPSTTVVKYTGNGEDYYAKPAVTWGTADSYGNIAGTITGFASNVLSARASMASNYQTAINPYVSLVEHTSKMQNEFEYYSSLSDAASGFETAILSENSGDNIVFEKSGGYDNSCRLGVKLDIAKLMADNKLLMPIASGDNVRITFDASTTYSTIGSAYFIVNGTNVATKALTLPVSTSLYQSCTVDTPLTFSAGNPIYFALGQKSGQGRIKNIKLKKQFASVGIQNIAVQFAKDLPSTVSVYFNGDITTPIQVPVTWGTSNADKTVRGIVKGLDSTVIQALATLQESPTYSVTAMTVKSGTTELTNTLAEGVIDVNASIKNTSVDISALTMIVALYNKNTKTLKQVAMSENAVPVQLNETAFNTSVTVPSDFENYELKVFLWDTLSGIVPLSNGMYSVKHIPQS